MTEDELFKKMWLFLYVAAGEEIGFEIKPVKISDASEGKGTKEQMA